MTTKDKENLACLQRDFKALNPNLGTDNQVQRKIAKSIFTNPDYRYVSEPEITGPINSVSKAKYIFLLSLATYYDWENHTWN
jgi:hypothetical protein